MTSEVAREPLLAFADTDRPRGGPRLFLKRIVLILI